MSSSLHHIMLATDFSPGSEAAAGLAFELARKFAARLTLLHVYSAPVYIGAFGDAYALPPEVMEKIRADAERGLEALALRAAKEGITAEPLAVEGLAPDLIVAAARSRRVDLIVMGTHGRTGLRHLLLGSVAERVVRTAECPVLTARAPAPGQPEGASS